MEVIVLDDKEPTKKKLKQSRLPFQTISPKIKLCDPSKKRKLSDTSLNDGERALKQVRCDSKENDSELINVILLSDNEDEPRPANQPDIATFFSSQSKTVKSDKCEIDNEKPEIKVSSPTETNLKSQPENSKPKEEDADKKETDIITKDVPELLKCFVDLSSSKINESELKFNVADSDDDLVAMEDSDHEDDLEESEEDQSQTSINGDLNTPSRKDGFISGDELTPKSTNVNSPLRKLTPRQLQRKLESQKKQEERERLKQEKLKKLQEEKEERLRKIQFEKEEKQRQKIEREEQKKKEREEKEEAKKKEREDKERKRLAEIEQKNEEKKQKEEERKKREEEKDAERRKREQETMEKEIKKKKAAEAFAKFFVPNTKSETKKSNENLNDTSDFSFMPFAVKSDMRMAPQCRVQFTDQDKLNLDKKLNSDVDKNKLYLNELKNGKPVGKSTRTYELVSNDLEDVIIVGDLLDADCIVETAPRPQKMRVKLLQFQENRRPPYWGTWRKQSDNVKARRPLGTDKKIFDYSIDSDDEWEEEEPGESLHGSDDEKDSDCDEKDEYDIDNEFMVPHGYLSDEEVIGEDDEVETPDSPNAHKVKLKALELEFQAELNEKPERLKPRIFGCLWANKDNSYSKQIPEPIQRYFRLRRILYNNPVILLSEDSDAFLTVKSNNTIRRKKIPEKYFPDLIRLLHGNNNKKVFLYKEFKTFISSIEEDLEISRNCFFTKLKEIAEYKACPDEGLMFNKQCWFVNQEFREKYNKDITLPNNWKYFLTPKRQSIVATNGGENTSIIENTSNVQKPKESKRVSGTVDITKYIKPLSVENLG